MAWSSPRTWVAGETVTAALLNTYIRDNDLALKAVDDNVAAILAGTSIQAVTIADAQAFRHGTQAVLRSAATTKQHTEAGNTGNLSPGASTTQNFAKQFSGTPTLVLGENGNISVTALSASQVTFRNNDGSSTYNASWIALGPD